MTICTLCEENYICLHIDMRGDLEHRKTNALNSSAADNLKLGNLPTPTTQNSYITIYDIQQSDHHVLSLAGK